VIIGYNDPDWFWHGSPSPDSTLSEISAMHHSKFRVLNS